MSGFDPRRALTVASLFLLLLASFATSSAAPRHDPGLCVSIDIDGIGPQRLAALQATPSFEWWVELDDRLLVYGEPGMLADLDGYEYQVLNVRVDPGRLHVVYGLHDDDAAAAGITVLGRGGRAAVVLADQDQLASVETAHGHGPKNKAGVRVAPFLPNQVLAHQARNSRRTRQAEFNVTVQAMVDAVNANRWFADIQTLSGWNRYTHNAGNIAARDWLVAQFQALPGLTVTTQSFTVGSTTTYNVIATLPGTTRPNDWYIVGGHMDSTSQSPSTAAPGAEDNASGTAGVLEMARIFTANPPDATVLFICYSGEEQGLYGSERHASSLVNTGDNAKVRAVFTMDMIGYTGDTDLDCLLETSSLGQFMIDALSENAAQYTTLRIVTSLNPWGSDHVPYLNRSMPALLTIENDYGSYPHYHRTTDTANNITLEMGNQILRMNVATLAEMAGTSPTGNGSDTIGAYATATGMFYLRNSNTAGNADLTFPFGPPNAGWTPLAGDWNGDGIDTIGLYDPAASAFYLRNSNSAGAADVAFGYGPPGGGWQPVVGDWDANGVDTVGLYNPGNGAFYLRNSNTPGSADISFFYGPPSSTPAVGDWNGDGRDTVAVFVNSSGIWYLRNSNSAGAADLAFQYGPANSGWTVLTGDWNGENTDTVGFYQIGSGTFLLRNSNSAGNAHITFPYGPPSGARPIRGDWDNL